MRLFPRTGDVSTVRVDELLARSSDRAQMRRLIVKDIEQALVEARSQEARLLTQARHLEHDLIDAKRLQSELTESARQALVVDREDLARSALNEKYESVEEAAIMRKRIDILTAKADAIAAETMRIEEVLASVRARQPVAEDGDTDVAE